MEPKQACLEEETPLEIDLQLVARIESRKQSNMHKKCNDNEPRFFFNYFCEHVFFFHSYRTGSSKVVFAGTVAQSVYKQ